MILPESSRMTRSIEYAWPAVLVYRSSALIAGQYIHREREHRTSDTRCCRRDHLFRADAPTTPEPFHDTSLSPPPPPIVIHTLRFAHLVVWLWLLDDVDKRKGRRREIGWCAAASSFFCLLLLGFPRRLMSRHRKKETASRSSSSRSRVSVPTRKRWSRCQPRSRRRRSIKSLVCHPGKTDPITHLQVLLHVRFYAIAASSSSETRKTSQRIFFFFFFFFSPRIEILCGGIPQYQKLFFIFPSLLF